MPMRNKGCGCCDGDDGDASIGIGLPGCLCQNTPATLSITVDTGGVDYGGAFRSGSLAYYADKPSYLSGSQYGGAAYYSSESWLDDSGAPTYYRVSCYGSQWSLGLGQYSGGIWQAPGAIYLWTIGGSPAVNSCDPFGLYEGRSWDGGNNASYFSGKIVISG